MSNITEEHIKKLGYKLVHDYDHDIYHTNRYQRNCLEVEFTYADGKLINVDLTIQEINFMPINHSQIKRITLKHCRSGGLKSTKDEYGTKDNRKHYC